MTDDTAAMLVELASLPERVLALEEMAGGWARVRMHDTMLMWLPELTPRELELLPYIVAGWSNREMAAELVIAKGTVTAHMTAILGKLQTNSRTVVALWALASGRVQMAEAVRLLRRYQPHLVAERDV